MIDPVEVAIAFVGRHPSVVEIVGERTAIKHQYGKPWAIGQAALVVQPDQSEINPNLPLLKMRLLVYCYAGTPQDASHLWLVLSQLAREACRTRVTTPHGDALMYHFLARTTPVLGRDDELKMDYALGAFEVMVHQEAL